MPARALGATITAANSRRASTTPTALPKGWEATTIQRAQREARAWVDQRIEEHLVAGESFGFESTYSGRSRPDVVRRAHGLGYDVQAIFIGTRDVSINIDRVAMRVRQRTGHDVPVEELARLR